MQLSPVEARVLGSLLEKEVTTPEQYPLSLNALVLACNQKTSREPVMELTEEQVRSALNDLEDKQLVSQNRGSRVLRFENRARTVFQLRRDETAVFTLLLLRGPQTPGALRARSERLHTFETTEDVVSALERLTTPQQNRPEPLVRELDRQPGTRESRFALILTGLDSSLAAPVTHTSGEGYVPDGMDQRMSALEERVARLEALLDSVPSK